MSLTCSNSTPSTKLHKELSYGIMMSTGTEFNPKQLHTKIITILSISDECRLILYRASRLSFKKIFLSYQESLIIIWAEEVSWFYNLGLHCCCFFLFLHDKTIIYTSPSIYSMCIHTYSIYMKRFFALLQLCLPLPDDITLSQNSVFLISQRSAPTVSCGTTTHRGVASGQASAKRHGGRQSCETADSFKDTGMVRLPMDFFFFF